MKKDIKLYNMILPPFLLLTFIPWLAALSLIGNFIIDSLVLLLISVIIFKRVDGNLYIKSIWKVWAFGFLSDFIGVIYLLISIIASDASYKGEDSLLDAISSGMYYAFNHGDSFYNIWSFIYMLSGIIIAAIAIFVFDYFISLKNVGLSKKQRLLSALSFAVFTAPYTFLLPNSLFY